MSKRPSSGRWQQRQARDPYVRRAQASGWRSRAAFKLLEIDEREHLVRKNAVVVDLGAAPGGWSQLVAEKVGTGGCVIAVDLLEMEPIAGVHCIQGDFTDEAVLREIAQALGERKADLVLSDTAPNISGNRSVDQPRAMHLAECALDLARQVLQPGGALIIKVFQGEGFEALANSARSHFTVVRIRKPAASRAESREMYLVAGNYRL